MARVTKGVGLNYKRRWLELQKGMASVTTGNDQGYKMRGLQKKMARLAKGDDSNYKRRPLWLQKKMAKVPKGVVQGYH